MDLPPSALWERWESGVFKAGMSLPASPSSRPRRIPRGSGLSAGLAPGRIQRKPRWRRCPCATPGLPISGVVSVQAGNIASAAGCPGGRLPAGGEAGNEGTCTGGVLDPLGVERQLGVHALGGAQPHRLAQPVFAPGPGRAQANRGVPAKRRPIANPYHSPAASRPPAPARSGSCAWPPIPGSFAAPRGIHESPAWTSLVVRSLAGPAAGCCPPPIRATILLFRKPSQKDSVRKGRRLHGWGHRTRRLKSSPTIERR